MHCRIQHAALVRACGCLLLMKHEMPDVSTLRSGEPAPFTLRGEERVTPWRFAAHFLSEFETWRSASKRWVTLFGPERQPNLWPRLMERCHRQVQRILGAPGFHRALTADRVAQRLLGEHIRNPGAKYSVC